jgi:threonine synthase
MGFVKGLQSRECDQEYPNEPLHVCETCFGPLQIVYDYDAIGATACMVPGYGLC